MSTRRNDTANTRPSGKSLTGSKRERTRSALIAATLDILESEGIAAASLDEIATRAGMTKGAIYSNFSGKADLLLAALKPKGVARRPARQASAHIEKELAAIAADLAATIRGTSKTERLIAEFQLYAIGDHELRADIAAVYAESFDRTACYLGRLEDLTPGMPRRDLAVALQCISLGFLVQSFMTPKAVTETVILKTMKALADGLRRTPKIHERSKPSSASARKRSG